MQGHNRSFCARFSLDCLIVLEKRKAIIGPKPARAQSKPFRNGIVEQE